MAVHLYDIYFLGIVSHEVFSIRHGSLGLQIAVLRSESIFWLRKMLKKVRTCLKFCSRSLCKLSRVINIARPEPNYLSKIQHNFGKRGKSYRKEDGYECYVKQ